MSDQAKRDRLKIECRWMLQIAKEQPALDLMKVCELAALKADEELADEDDDAPETERQPYTYDAPDDCGFEFPEAENDNADNRPEGDDSPTGGGWLAR